jgi:hypothetical protein
MSPRRPTSGNAERLLHGFDRPPPRAAPLVRAEPRPRTKGSLDWALSTAHRAEPEAGRRVIDPCLPAACDHSPQAVRLAPPTFEVCKPCSLAPTVRFSRPDDDSVTRPSAQVAVTRPKGLPDDRLSRVSSCLAGAARSCHVAAPCTGTPAARLRGQGAPSEARRSARGGPSQLQALARRHAVHPSYPGSRSRPPGSPTRAPPTFGTARSEA